MVTRIVKLEFHPDRVDDFINYFDTIKQQVNSFPGCIGMKLYQDISNPSIIMTYSHWETEKDLDNYRNSDTFSVIWPSIKPWFNGKPEAWSLNTYFNGFE